jgi:O-antigen ligase
MGYSVMAFSIFFSLAYQKIFFMKSAIIAMTLSLTLVSLWGLWNSYENQGLWLETARHNGSASYISYTLILIPLLLFAQCLFVQQRFWIISFLVLLILTSFLSGQRIFIVALLAELVIFILWAKQYLNISTQKLLIISTVFILLSTLLAFASLLNRFDGSIETAIHYQRYDPRLELFSIPLDLIKNAPLIGYGFGRETMLHVIGGEAALEQILQNYPKGYQYNHAHNVLLNIAIEVGLLGLVIFASVFICLFRQYYHCAKYAKPIVAAAGMAGIAILVGFLIRNQSNDMFYRDISLFFWSTQGLLLGFIVKIQSKKET